MKTAPRTIAALVCAATASSALAQPFETAIGSQSEERLEDTIYRADYDGPASVGWTGDTINADIYAVQQKADGSIVWQTILAAGGTDTADEVVTSEENQGYVIVGETNSFAPLFGIGLHFLDAAGNYLYSIAHEGQAFVGGSTGGADIYASADGGFLLSGRRQQTPGVIQAPVAIKTRPDGSPLWSNYYIDVADPDSTFMSFADIHEFVTADGNLHSIVVGHAVTNPFSFSRDTLVARINQNGIVLWANLYKFDNFSDEAIGVEITNNHDILVTGFNKNIGEGGGTFLMQLDPAGNLNWYNTYRGISPTGSLKETPSGDIAVLGNAFDLSTPGDETALMLTDPFGIPLWVNRFGGQGQEFAEAVDLAPQGFLIGSWTNSFAFGSFDFYTVSADSNGRTGCERPWDVLVSFPEPEIVPLELRAIEQPEWFTVQMDPAEPGFPFAYVCDQPDPCPACACDWAAPLGVCDFNDVVAFLGAFGSGDPCAAGLAPPVAIADFNDVVAFLGQFSTGCP